jgi:hypothetical protein
VPLGLKVDISLKKIADWEMQMYWDPLVFEMSERRISREAICDRSWRPWGAYRLRKNNFYTESVPSLFKWWDVESAFFGRTNLTT